MILEYKMRDSDKRLNVGMEILKNIYIYIED